MSELRLWELENPSLGNLLEAKAKLDGNNTILLFEDQKVTYTEFDDRANRAANGLLELGVKKGDTVCLWLPNCPEWLYLWFGMAKIGAVLVPVLPGLSGNHLAHLINQSDAKTIVLDASFLSAFDAVAKRLKKIKNIVVEARASSPGTVSLPQGSVLLETLFDCSAESPQIGVRHPDVACIIYTSGTTGLPKGLVTRHFPPIPKPTTPASSDPYAEYFKPGAVAYMCYPLATWFGGFVAWFVRDMVTAFSREKRYDRFWDDARRYNASFFM